MFKKSFVSLIIISFLNYVGCYSSEFISKKEVDQGTKQIDLNEEISIVTKDYNSYHFPPEQYQIQNDTLYGVGLMTKLGKEVPFKGKIAWDDILSFEQNSIDAGATTGLVLGVIAIGVIIVGVVLAAAFATAINPD